MAICQKWAHREISWSVWEFSASFLNLGKHQECSLKKIKGPSQWIDDDGELFSIWGRKQVPPLQFSDYGWAIPSRCALVKSQRKVEKSVRNEPDAPKHNPERRFLSVSHWKDWQGNWIVSIGLLHWVRCTGQGATCLETNASSVKMDKKQSNVSV